MQIWHFSKSTFFAEIFFLGSVLSFRTWIFSGYASGVVLPEKKSAEVSGTRTKSPRDLKSVITEEAKGGVSVEEV
uniref:Uncharacterized protein n=1 Tax=Ixodes ricinus TaxID=34613 RepID=A0A6B0TTL0_IXORI